MIGVYWLAGLFFFSCSEALVLCCLLACVVVFAFALPVSCSYVWGRGFRAGGGARDGGVIFFLSFPRTIFFRKYVFLQHHICIRSVRSCLFCGFPPLLWSSDSVCLYAYFQEPGSPSKYDLNYFYSHCCFSPTWMRGPPATQPRRWKFMYARLSLSQWRWTTCPISRYPIKACMTWNFSRRTM